VIKDLPSLHLTALSGGPNYPYEYSRANAGGQPAGVTMNFLLDHRLSDVAEICRHHGVERLEAFGSVVREDFDPLSSDLDFIVRFAPPHGLGYAERYLNLAEALEHLFDRPVDIMTERSLRNPILKQTIAAERRIIYDA